MGWNGADGAPADHFAHSRRRIENNEVTLATIAGSLLRIFVRMEKLDASLGLRVNRRAPLTWNGTILRPSRC